MRLSRAFSSSNCFKRLSSLTPKPPYFFSSCKRWLQVRYGAYWVEMITKGQGTYWDCNRDVSKYKRCGIGMISWNDTQKLQCLLVDVLPYLTYVNKDIRLRITEDSQAQGYQGDVRARSFWRGTIS